MKMSDKNKKQFGVWMDSHHATVVGRENTEEGNFIILAHEKSDNTGGNSNENAGNNAENNALNKLFKSISAHMVNAQEVHVTGTGVAQEQFIKYLSNTPQFKNTAAKETTSKKMSDKELVDYITGQFS